MKLLNRMRNTGYAILGGLAIISFSSVAGGCSDNEENGLYAADDSNIDITIEAMGFHNGLLDLGSAQSSTVFEVTSTTRWTVDVTNCEGAWCQIVYGESDADAAGHIGNGNFTVEAAPNRSGNSRECTVTVYAIESDGTHIPGKSIEINVVQDRQSIQVDYAGDEISYLGTINGPYPTITVKANQAWVASSSHSWVKIIPGPQMDGDRYDPPTGSAEERSVTFQISVEANPGTSVRYAEVSISSPTSAFTPIRLNVTQAASTETFFITPTEVPQVSWTGDTIEFNVYSPRDSWKVEAISVGNWVTLDQASGEAASEPVTIKAKIAENNTSAARQASIMFTRGGNLGTMVVYINQNANAEAPAPDSTPKLSRAWIRDGWTATFAEVSAYFASPVYPIVEGGMIFKSYNGYDQSVRGVVSGNMITATLSGLEPDTRYTVTPFVIYSKGGYTEVATGETMDFTTPALDGNPGSGLPGEGDNTPPSPN